MNSQKSEPSKEPPKGTATTKNKRRRRAGAPVRRVYHAQDQVRAAFMAGQGLSGKEIAEAIGGTTSARIREMLRKCGIKMQRRPGAEDIMILHWSRKDRRRLDELSGARDYDPLDIAVTILRAVLAEPVLFDNLIDQEVEGSS